MRAQSFLSVTFIVTSQAMDFSLTILISWIQYSHLSLKSIQVDRLISRNEKTGTLVLFGLSCIEMRKLPFRTINTSRTGIERRLDLSLFGASSIQLCNKFAFASYYTCLERANTSQSALRCASRRSTFGIVAGNAPVMRFLAKLDSNFKTFCGTSTSAF